MKKHNFKENLNAFIAKAKNKKYAITAGVAAAAPALMSVSASAASETGTAFTAPSIADSVNGAMFNQILTQMTDLLPILLPVVVGCLAFRKGISFLRSMIMGA